MANAPTNAPTNAPDTAYRRPWWMAVLRLAARTAVAGCAGLFMGWLVWRIGSEDPLAVGVVAGVAVAALVYWAGREGDRRAGTRR